MRTARLLAIAGATAALCFTAVPAYAAGAPSGAGTPSGSATSGGSVSAGAASGSDGCDTGAVVGWWDTTGGGSGFSHDGRAIDLLTESVFDAYAHAVVDDPHAGDKIWTDRSVNLMPSDTPTHPSRQDVIDNGGWKQCGPYEVSGLDEVLGYAVSGNVYLNKYAVRACYRTAGTSTSACGEWYVDHDGKPPPL